MQSVFEMILISKGPQENEVSSFLICPLYVRFLPIETTADFDAARRHHRTYLPTERVESHVFAKLPPS
jgi:hypothetical protein